MPLRYRSRSGLACLFLLFAWIASAAQAPPPATGVFVAAPAATGTNPIAAIRLLGNTATLPNPGWSTAGIVGGVPTRTACVTAACNTVAGGTVTTASVNAAITSAPANTTIVMPAGPFTIANGFVVSARSNITLKGQGANSTLLTFTGTNTDNCGGTPSANICVRSTDVHYQGGASNVADWTAGYARGATTVTLSSVTNLAVGKPLGLDQLKDTSDTGQEYSCEEPPCANGGGGQTRTGRPQAQITTVTSIGGNGIGCSPTPCFQVGISPGLIMTNWRSNRTPQAFWATSPSFGIGLEDFSIDGTAATAQSANIFFWNCSGCWAKGIRSVLNGGAPGGSGRSHLIAWGSPRVEVRDSYFFGQQDWQLVTAYGIETAFTSDSRIENNIFQQVQAPVVMTGPTDASVLGYNFALNDRVSNNPAFMDHMLFCHNVQNFVLIEGNIGPGLLCDSSSGTHNFVTVFRNRFLGYDVNGTTVTSQSTVPIALEPYSRFFNVVGNVLGDDRRPHNVYEANTDQTIYKLGTTNYSGLAANPDARTTATLLRWGNYDTVTNAARFLAGEVPTGESVYPNTVPASQTLPSSLYLAAKPVWWPASLAFPAIGPDITGGTLTSADGHGNPNPAYRCYSTIMGGPANGSGSPLMFSAALCGYP